MKIFGGARSAGLTNRMKEQINKILSRGMRVLQIGPRKCDRCGSPVETELYKETATVRDHDCKTADEMMVDQNRRDDDWIKKHWIGELTQLTNEDIKKMQTITNQENYRHQYLVDSDWPASPYIRHWMTDYV